jgi:hypothetical protein
MTTPSEEVAALEFCIGQCEINGSKGGQPHWMRQAKIARDSIRLHHARLAVVEAAARLRAKGPGYASMDLDAAVEALLALGEEVEKVQHVIEAAREGLGRSSLTPDYIRNFYIQQLEAILPKKRDPLGELERYMVNQNKGDTFLDHETLAEWLALVREARAQGVGK